MSTDLHEKKIKIEAEEEEAEKQKTAKIYTIHKRCVSLLQEYTNSDLQLYNKCGQYILKNVKAGQSCIFYPVLSPVYGVYDVKEDTRVIIYQELLSTEFHPQNEEVTSNTMILSTLFLYAIICGGSPSDWLATLHDIPYQSQIAKNKLTNHLPMQVLAIGDNTIIKANVETLEER